MSDESSNPTHLLTSLLMGSVTSQQWETYKQMKNDSGDLICSDESEDETDEDDDDERDNDDGDANTDETDKRRINEWNKEMTVKYLDGEITFNELTDIMENYERNEPQDTSGERPEVEFEKEFLKSQNRGKSARKSSPKERAGRPRTRLARDLVGLLGEANVAFARGEHSDALRMCMEVIRLAPVAPEPFQSLGMFYEEMGDDEKAFQVLLIAAYLCPSDGEGWNKLAEMAQEQGNTVQAITCYSKAIKVFPDNIKLHFQRCQLYEKIGDMKKAIEGYEHLIRALEPNDGELALQLAKDIIKIHYNNGEISAGIEVMESILNKYHKFVTSEEVNVYLELLISEKQFIKSLMTFQKFCGIKLKIGDNECQEITEEIINGANITVQLVYEEFPIDLRAKLIVTLINLNCMTSLDELLEDIINESADEIGDLYVDIVDAFIHMKLYQKANPLLLKLLDTEKYNISDIWFRYAKSLEKCNNIESCIIAYSTVVRLSPNNFEARLSLSNLFMNIGRDKEALEASNLCESDGEINLDLLFVRCKLLYSSKLWTEFSYAATLLLQSDMLYLSNSRELSIMVTSTTHRTRIESLRDVHRELSIFTEHNRPKFIGKPIDKDDLLNVLVKLLHCLKYKLHDDRELIRIVFSAYTCPSFEDNAETIDYYALMCCYITNNVQYTYPLVKACITRYINNNQIWNLFCPIMMRLYQDLRHNRFCIRLFIKNPENLALAYFNGHNALMSGSYKHALAEYVCILKQQPNDPFAALCVSLGFVHMACQKYTSNRHAIVIQMCAFLDVYLDLRGECQESLYNVGRSFHQLGLYHNAVHFYKRALLYSTIQSDTEKMYDLRREIVFNLVSIYRNTGANDLALQLLKTHFVV